jgi:hypothetical protein
MSNEEKIIIQSFKKFVSTALTSPEELSKICPSSYKHKTIKFKKRKFSALSGRKILSSYEKYTNCKYLLTKYVFDLSDTMSDYIYEIWMIDSERTNLSDIQSPILFKVI